jgi:hypothetical protein
MRSVASTLIAGALAVSACATGGGSPGEDGGTIKDSGVTKDAGGGNDSSNDSGGGQDSAPDVVDNCVKAPPSNVCGVYPQCDCASKQTCEVNQSQLDGSSSCVAAGTKTRGQSCTATVNECAPGLTCIWGQCHEYCGSDGSMCTSAGTNYCLNLTDNNQKPIPNLLICHNDCQLEDPSSCGGGSEGCVYFDVDKVDCYPVGTASTCSATTSCKPGYSCVNQSSVYTCHPWCRVGASDCTTGTCMPFSTPPHWNGYDYGFCQ